MKNCSECKFLVCYSGSKDRYGIPQEPDDYECVAEPTEEEIDRFFCNGESWNDNEKGCSWFEQRDFNYD